MTRKAAKWYPGKPGPQPTGLKRDILFPLQLDKDEFEYLNRKSTKALGKKRMAGPWARKKLFRSGWRAELLTLRKEQGANIP